MGYRMPVRSSAREKRNVRSQPSRLQGSRLNPSSLSIKPVRSQDSVMKHTERHAIDRSVDSQTKTKRPTSRRLSTASTTSLTICRFSPDRAKPVAGQRFKLMYPMISRELRSYLSSSRYVPAHRCRRCFYQLSAMRLEAFVAQEAQQILRVSGNTHKADRRFTWLSSRATTF